MSISSFFSQADSLVHLVRSAALDIESTAAREPGLLMVAGALLVVLSLALLKVR